MAKPSKRDGMEIPRESSRLSGEEVIDDCAQMHDIRNGGNEPATPKAPQEEYKGRGAGGPRTRRGVCGPADGHMAVPGRKSRVQVSSSKKTLPPLFEPNQDKPGEDKKSGDLVIDAAKVLLLHHGAPKEVVLIVGGLMKQYFDSAPDETSLIKRIKYVTLCPMSDYLRNERPEEADAPFRFTGNARRWIKQRIFVRNTRNTHLWYSWLQLKRAAGEVSDDFVLENFLKHRAQMAKSDPLMTLPLQERDDLVEEIVELLGPVLGTVKSDVTRKLWPSGPATHMFTVPEFSNKRKLNSYLRRRREALVESWSKPSWFKNPSMVHKASESASWESTRAREGACGHLRRLISPHSDFGDPACTMRHWSLHHFHEEAGLLRMSNSSIATRPLNRVECCYDELESLEIEKEIELNRHVKRGRKLRCQVQAVKEPLKVRTITKGETIPYFIAKPVQVAIHDSMRKMDMFRLIGRPLRATDVADCDPFYHEFSLLERREKKLVSSRPRDDSEYEDQLHELDLIRTKRDELKDLLDSRTYEWHSVDYQAATDGLSATLSEACMEEILGGLAVRNLKLYHLCLSVLAPHLVYYPEVRRSRKWLERVRVHRPDFYEKLVHHARVRDAFNPDLLCPPGGRDESDGVDNWVPPSNEGRPLSERTVGILDRWILYASGEEVTVPRVSEVLLEGASLFGLPPTWSAGIGNKDREHVYVDNYRDYHDPQRGWSVFWKSTLENIKKDICTGDVRSQEDIEYLARIYCRSDPAILERVVRLGIDLEWTKDQNDPFYRLEGALRCSLKYESVDNWNVVNTCTRFFDFLPLGQANRLFRVLSEEFVCFTRMKHREGFWRSLEFVVSPQARRERVRNENVIHVRLRRVVQKNGQLMGSILSFPILCLLNLGLYLLVKKRCNSPFSTSTLLRSNLTNGDDQLYLGTKEEWDMHVKLGRLIGLEMSPGKAYRSAFYANVNSTSVICPLTPSRKYFDTEGNFMYKSLCPREVKFLNLGLFMGQHKVMSKNKGRPPISDLNVHPLEEELADDLWKRPHIAVLQEILDGSLEEKRGDIFRLYCSKFSKEISEEAQGRNLFIHPSLGGFGIKRPNGISTNYTVAQYQLAASRIRRYKLERISNPLPPGKMISDLQRRVIDPVRATAEAQEDERRGSRRDTSLIHPLDMEQAWIPYQVNSSFLSLIESRNLPNHEDIRLFME